MRTTVLAFGGNAITREGQAGTYDEQAMNARPMAAMAADLLAAGYRVVITHGNGPQVGNLAVQQEEGQRLVPAQPLFVLGAMTQGQIGHLLGLGLSNLQQNVAVADGRCQAVVPIVTHVLVDPSDPAFELPTKPIGPFFDEKQARELADQRGWQIIEDAGRGYRRVVPSPEPKAILEAEAIHNLVEAGFIVVAAGGGGIPVVRRDGKLAGIDAVIDKDLAAERLASSVGAHSLVLITGADRVVLNFRTPDECPIEEMTVEEAQSYLDEGQFPPGSMGPKVRAAIRFVQSGGTLAVITSAEHAVAALAGRHGTRIVSAQSGVQRATIP